MTTDELGQRYWLFGDSDDMEPSADGEWVRYEDFQRLRVALEQIAVYKREYGLEWIDVAGLLKDMAREALRGAP